jgi:hypothetical protein
MQNHYLSFFFSIPDSLLVSAKIFLFNYSTIYLLNTVIASPTEVIFSASSLEISIPKFSSIATTNSTPSKESNPNSSNVAVLDSLSTLHFAADFNT